MNITKRVECEVATLEVEGRIDTVTSVDLEKVVDEILDNRTVKEIIFDFLNTAYISSAGLRVILGAQKRLNDYCGIVTIKNANEDIMEIFEMTGFSDILNIQ